MDDQPSSPPTPYDFTVDAAPPATIEERKSSYSLLLLFYVTTIAAIVAAVCRLAFVDNNITTQTLFVGYVIAGAVCIIMAMLLGYFIGRTWLSTGLGMFAGMLCALVALLMAFVQPTHYAVAGLLICAGCWFMSILAIVANRFGK